MKIYGGGRAPNPRRVSIFVAEKGIEIETELVDIGKLDQKSPEFAAIYDRQRVPVLELDDGTRIAESVAICRYLESLHPEPCLFGEGALQQAQVEMWQRRAELEVLMPVAMSFRHLHPVAVHLEPIQVEEWGKVSQGFAQEGMQMLDNQLAANAFIAGDDFSIADITAFVALQFLKPARLAFDEEHKNLLRWFEEVSQRPSVAI